MRKSGRTAQILYSYPPERPVEQQLVSFCFPHGIQAKLLPRTPDMKALQDVMYSQRYQQDDSLSFVFLMKVLPPQFARAVGGPRAARFNACGCAVQPVCNSHHTDVLCLHGSQSEDHPHYGYAVCTLCGLCPNDDIRRCQAVDGLESLLHVPFTELTLLR